MPFDVNPITPVGAQIKPPQGMSLAEMVNMAGGIQAYKQAQQMNPLLLRQAESAAGTSEEQRKQAGIRTEADKLAFNQKQFDALMREQVALINDKDVIAAEQAPDMVNTDALVAKVMDRGMKKAKLMGIPEDRATELMQPYAEMAKNNPGELRNYLKERHIAAVDDAARTGVLTPSGPVVSYGSGGALVQTNPFAEGPIGSTVFQYQQGLAPTRELYMRIKDSSGNEVLAPVNQAGQIIGGAAPAEQVGPAQAAPRGGIVSPRGAPTAPGVPAPAPAPAAAPMTAPAAAPAGGQAGAGANLRKKLGTPGYKYTYLPSGSSEQNRNALEENRQKYGAAANAAKNLVYYSNEILRLADETPTGQESELNAKISSLPGIRNFFTTGSNLAELNKYLTASAVTAGDSIGMTGTDNKVNMMAAMTGTTKTPNDALKAVARSTRAITGIATTYFQQGLENAIARADADPNYKYPSVYVTPKVQNMFNSIDPLAILYASFKDNKDTEGAQILRRNLGLVPPEGFKGTNEEWVNSAKYKNAKERWGQIFSDYQRLLQLKQGNIDGL